jgi:hypothetical protein
MGMNMDDSRLIARFQRLTTELLIEKQLGQRRPELTSELYQTWLEVEQRGLKKTPEYRKSEGNRHQLQAVLGAGGAGVRRLVSLACGFCGRRCFGGSVLRLELDRPGDAPERSDQVILAPPR